MIKLNNVKIESPVSCTIGLKDVTKGERDSKANLHMDYIAKKWKLELAWGVLEQEQLSEILHVLENNINFSATFISPIDGKEKTATFYKGDRSFPILIVKNGKVTWKDFKVNLIEV